VRRWFYAVIVSVWASPVHAAPPCMWPTSDPVLLELDGNSLRMCQFDGRALTCFTEDLATGKWSPAAAPKTDDRPRVVPAATAPKVTTGEHDATVCHSDGSACKKLAAKGPVDPGQGISAGANEAGTIGALEYLASGPQSDTFDLATGKRIASFSAHAKKGHACGGVDVLGESVVVGTFECGTNTGEAWIGSKTGKKLAAVGGTKPIVPAGFYVHVDGDVWAFSSIGGDAVVLQDVKTGKVTKRIEVGKPDKATVALLGDAKRLVIVYGGERAGDVAVIDLGSDKIVAHPGTRCSG
jgi:hypothetical protein